MSISKKLAAIITLATIVVAATTAALELTPLSEIDFGQIQDFLQRFLEQARGSPYALPIVLGIYIVAGYLMLSVMALNLMIAMIFGPFWGVLYGLAGAMLSAALMFETGRTIGKRFLRRLMGPRLQQLDRKFSDAGTIGVTAIRFIPIAPYGAMNLAAGVSSVSFFDYLAGTLLALTPGAIARGIVGDSIMQLIINPTAKTAIYLFGGFVFWLLVVFFTHIFLKRYSAKAS